MTRTLLLGLVLWSLPALLSACDDGGRRGHSLAALAKCQVGLQGLERVPTEQIPSSLTEACLDLVPPGPCRQTLERLDGLSPDLRAGRLATACRQVACGGLRPPLPAWCAGDPTKLDPAQRMAAIVELQIAWVKQRICPRWRGVGAPQVCSLQEVPASTAQRARLMDEFFRADPDLRSDEFLQVAILPMLLVAHEMIVVRAPPSPGSPPGP